MDKQPMRFAHSRRSTDIQMHYRQADASTWLDGSLPYVITNNIHLAQYHSHAIREWCKAGAITRPIHVIELGCGLGLYAHYLCQQLERLTDNHHLPGWHYHLTDIQATSPLELCPRLASAQRSDKLEWQQLDLTDHPQVDELLDRLSEEPIVIIANYVVDSLPCNLYQASGTGSIEELACLEDEDGGKPNYTWQPIMETALSEPLMLQQPVPQNGQTRVISPIWHYFLERIAKHPSPSLVLVSDKGWPEAVPVAPDITDYIVPHDKYFDSLPVDFDYWAARWRAWGGEACLCPHSASFFVQALFKGVQEQPLSASLSDYPGTQAWQDAIYDDCLAPPNTIRDLLHHHHAWSGDDHALLHWACHASLLVRDEEACEADIDTMAETLKELPWFCHGEAILARFYAAIGALDKAISALEESLGVVDKRFFPHLWLCALYRVTDNIAEATRHYEAALAIENQPDAIERELDTIKNYIRHPNMSDS